MSPFFPAFIIFLVILTYSLRKNSRLEQEDQTKFWEKERLSNSTRKKDISNLSYLTIPLEDFPLGKYQDETLASIEQELQKLSEESILNLNGISNTQLKLDYGVANLDFLSGCDENYIRLIRLLQEYGSRLSELSHPDDAVTVLRYAVQSGSDISDTYLLLADLYLASGQTGQLNELAQAAGMLHSPRRDAIVEKLNSRLNA